MVILGFIAVMIFALILMDYINVPIINESPLGNNLHLHWLFVIGSVFGQGIQPLQYNFYDFIYSITL